MARMLRQPSSDGSYWTINLNSTDISPCPPTGLLKFDLHMKVKHTSLVQSQDEEHGNPIHHLCEFNFPTLRLFSTLNRTQYSSALHRWLRQLLHEDVVNDVTDHVIEHLFENTTLHEIFAVHVQIEMNRVMTVELDQDPVDEIEEEEEDDVAGGLSRWLITLLMMMSEFPAPAKEELEGKGLRDCSICLEDLLSVGGEEKTNYLFESGQCGHIFHGECMKKWLRINDSCPLCRVVVSSEIKRIWEEIMSSYRLE